MNSKPLITNVNIDNNQWQCCRGCDRNFPPSSFTSSGKSYRTCNTCRIQNKAVYQRKLIHKQENYADDQTAIEFHDFYDFFANLFENSTNNEEQENNNS